MKKLLVLCLLLLGAAPALALTLSRDTTWQGERKIGEEVRVESGATLTIRPGSRITFHGGHLEVAGRLVAEDVDFSGSGWGGILLKGCDSTTIIRNCRITGAKTGLFIGGGAPRIEGTTLENNEVGIELKQQSSAAISLCRISGNRKVGLFIKDESSPHVSGCTISKNGKYGVYIYRAQPAAFTGNTLSENDTALMISNAGSDPRIQGNIFSQNKIAILVDRAARPLLTGNLLRDNQTGVRLYRRADAAIDGNRFEKNNEALSIAYSSYPRIHYNDFVANRRAITLEFQSSRWEKSNGSTVRESEAESRGAFGQGSGHAADAEARRRPDAELDGTIDARHNWWGEQESRELNRIGTSGNPTFIDDGRDAPTFVDGGKEWPLDRVNFTPWQSAPNRRARESL
ncbi:MAG: right-handed parallel beta-helix repeat-containing protein [Desulfuromonadales bacterium]|nr:right-handed parallel beta-helix repeat-containing protein [Desulfuromonadales bacterium]